MKQIASYLLLVCPYFFAPAACSETAHEEERVKTAISYFFQQPNDLSIHLISGGYSKASNFYVKDGGNEYVLRIYTTGQSIAEIQGEFYALEKASELGVAPYVYGVFLEGKAILMEYIPGHTLSIEEAKKPENGQKMGEALRRAHSMAKNPHPNLTFLEKTEKFYQEVSHETLSKKAMDLFRDEMNKLTKQPGAKVTIHGDPGARNIFIGEKGVFLIDWCDTRWDDPFFDLSFFSLLLGYTESEDELLLKSYLQRPMTRAEKARFDTIKKINLAEMCIRGLHLMQRLPKQVIDRSTSPKDWLYYADAVAKNDRELTAQFFFEFATLALRRAQEEF